MGEESKPLNATFMGNSTAEVSGICKYILPSGDSLRLKVHRTYGSDKAVKMELVRNAIAGALKQTGPMFRPEEAFITRRDEFTTLVLDQLEQGLFETETETQEREEIEDEFIDETTGKSHKKVKIIREQVTKLRYKDGKPIIKRISALKTHGIIITDLVIKNFNFDTLTTTNIQLKKRAEQEQVVAKAKSETAKQNAIKEKHEGDARIAKARADEEVEKITAVTQAEKARDVMTLKAEEAEQFALKIKREGEARAYAAKKLVDAGLTPLKRAEIERDTKIGMAEAWAKRPVPTFIAGGSSNGQTDPLAPLGFKAMVDLVNGLD
jgi:regulator of protease activity HflC (stomatin/prohibitin superfamily)